MSWKDKFNVAEREREGFEEEEELYEGSLYAHYKGMKWWKTIAEGFKILAKTYLPTLLIFVSFAVLFSLLLTFAMAGYNWTVTNAYENQIKPLIALNGEILSEWPQADQDLYSDFRQKATWLNVITIFITYLPMTFSGVFASHYIIEHAKGNENVKLFDSIKHTFRGSRLVITLLSTLILAIIISAGFSFFIIFGVVVLIMIGLCIPVLVDTDFEIKEVLTEGFKLAKEFRLRTTILLIISIAFFSYFGNNLAVLILPDISDSMRLAWLNPTTRNWGALLGVNLVNQISVAFFYPILFTFLAAHYLELVVQKKAAWFDYMGMTEKKPLKLTQKDIIMNVVPAGIILMASLVSSIFVLIAYFQG